MSVAISANDDKSIGIGVGLANEKRLKREDIGDQILYSDAGMSEEFDRFWMDYL